MLEGISINVGDVVPQVSARDVGVFELCDRIVGHVATVIFRGYFDRDTSTWALSECLVVWGRVRVDLEGAPRIPDVGNRPDPDWLGAMIFDKGSVIRLDIRDVGQRCCRGDRGELHDFVKLDYFGMRVVVIVNDIKAIDSTKVYLKEKKLIVDE